ncbi:MAG: hypothetical protein H8E64_06590 [Candidatus Marinimicrobia bacterium]|nr:hypothetical protein [Candidatus Neomarinimicrobiota bacterium]
MKKTTILVLFVSLILNVVFAGGLVVNTNQSAEFIRTMNRNHSTEVDAVHFNPAGLTNLNDGWHLYLSNQTIKQHRTVYVMTDSTNGGAPIPYNNESYGGTTFAPVFPNLYVVYKSGRVALSGGFMPVGGGGSATFPEGLPAFETELAGTKGLPSHMFALAVGAPNPFGFVPYGPINGYSLDAAFEGSSIYLGFQGNVSLALSKMVSLSAGARYVMANNEYIGHLRDITLFTENNPGGDGFGELTIEGIPYLSDKEVEASKSGSGITGIFGVNFNFGERMNVGVKYETMTELALITSTIADSVDLFPDGDTTNADIPAFLTVGLSFRITDNLTLNSSFGYYWNHDVNWDWAERGTTPEAEASDFVNNGFEGGIAAEYMLNEKLMLSAGYLYNVGGAKDEYNSDMDYSNPKTDTYATGIRYYLGEATAITVGFSHTVYDQAQNTLIDTPFEEHYDKTANVIAFGVQHHF